MTALLTEPEAADILHLSPRTLRLLRAQGKIRYIRPSPRKVLYSSDDLAEYIAKQTRQDNPSCPSTSPRKAVSGNTTSSSKVIGIMDRLAARPGAMRNGSRQNSGGKSR